MKLFLWFSLVFQVALSLEDFFGNVVIPSEVSTTIDESIYIKMRTPIDKQTKCEYQAPGKKERNSLDFFVKFTNDECGIKIDKLQKYHEGIWKLISTYKNSSLELSIKGTSHVKVKDKILVPNIFTETAIFSPKDNFAPPNVELNYCHVVKDTGESLITEMDTKKCMIPENVGHKDFQNGLWKVRVGVKGVANEISYSVNIQSTGES